MRPSRIVALVIGCLMLLPGIGLLFGGGALAIAYAAGRNDSGYFEATADRPAHPHRGHHRRDPHPDQRSANTNLVDRRAGHRPATAGHRPEQRRADLRRNRPSRRRRRLPGRRRPRRASPGSPNGTPMYRTSHRTGAWPQPPTEQTFWAATASGPGTQQLSWQPNRRPMGRRDHERGRIPGCHAPPRQWRSRPDSCSRWR